MRVHLVMLISLAGVACKTELEPRPPPSRPSPRSVGIADTIRSHAHDVLAKHCGSCHESHRTAVVAALEIFDLDQPAWYAGLDARRFDAGLRRLGSKPEADRQAFMAPRDLELAR